MSLIKTLKKKIRGVGKRIGLMDDFNWSDYYEEEYSKQIYNLEREYTFVIPNGKYSVVNGKIVLAKDIYPLHPNHKNLYETVYSLKPDSILEVGCGCGDHLANIKKILPQVKLHGSDLSEKQLEFLWRRHPELKSLANVFVQDLTSKDYRKVEADLVYTQAVLMHIRRRPYYLQALKNIFSSAKKYVVLMENWNRRDYVKDIKELTKGEGFPWKKIYFYKNKNGDQKILIVSPVTLSQFQAINNGEELL